MRLGLPTLLKYSAFYSGATETDTLFREAFGLNAGSFPCKVLRISQQYTRLDHITADTKGVLLKSRTGTGKSTLAFEKCRRLLKADPLARILYIVSSRALAWSATASFNEKWTTYMFSGNLKPQFTCYMSEPGPLSKHQLTVCSIQSCWRTSVNRVPYSSAA